MNDKLKIIELLKQQVAAKTAELTPKNIQKITQDIQDLLKILNDVVAIDFIDTTSETSLQQENTAVAKPESNAAVAPTTTQTAPETKSEPKQQTQPQQPQQPKPLQPKSNPEPETPLLSEHWLNNHKSYIGRFHLDLNGGHVGTIKVSESKLHKMKNPPENGDWVRADEYQDSDSVNYKITTLKRDPLPTEIVRLKFLPAVFREDVKRWYIEFQSPEHETRQQLLLGDYDVMLFKLKPGDYIDYAYRRGQEINGKIIWRYTDSAAVATRMKQRYAKSANTDADKTAATSKQKVTQTANKAVKPAKRRRAVQQVFADKTLLLVCFENSAMPRKVKRHVEKRGGKLVLSSHSDSGAMLKKKVQKSDVVIVTTDFVGHSQMFAAKDEAKRIGKPIWMARNTNERNLLQWYKRHFPNESKPSAARQEV
ncbi:DUF2325 domain-containing protein [Lacticaseibacillus rhamnosus]|uniref:DUF2325 domain-containing protein n=1 Tax=Lacticaseibacillus rhamnosus TaxID=47715 RepID=UPI000BAAD7A0|nr:DUF2325 domain-containing protein [Lacticaseibacillus rhamnosus]ASX16150.1 hypothetical protein BGK71_01470 [Lacticaseibacillus rhamnosus]